MRFVKNNLVNDFSLEGVVGSVSHREGYATEAARAALCSAFDHLNVSRVDLRCQADNSASQRVAKRLGFRQEGCQRLRHRKKDGTLVDRLWYGLLREEWEAESVK